MKYINILHHYGYGYTLFFDFDAECTIAITYNAITDEIMRVYYYPLEMRNTMKKRLIDSSTYDVKKLK